MRRKVVGEEKGTGLVYIDVFTALVVFDGSHMEGLILRMSRRTESTPAAAAAIRDIRGVRRRLSTGTTFESHCAVSLDGRQEFLLSFR